MRKTGFYRRKLVATLAGVIGGWSFLLTPVIAHAEDVNMGFSDSVALKLTSPPSNSAIIIAAIGGVLVIVTLGLALSYRRNKGKTRHEYLS